MEPAPPPPGRFHLTGTRHCCWVMHAASFPIPPSHGDGDHLHGCLLPRRALKTRGNTPKYGLIFHSTFIGRAAAKNKGRISRYLANKCTIASRIDCFSGGLQKLPEPSPLC